VTELGTFRYFSRIPWARGDGTFALRANAPALSRTQPTWRWSRSRAFARTRAARCSLSRRTSTAFTARLARPSHRGARPRGSHPLPAPGCANGAPTGSLHALDFDLDAFLADPSTATLPRAALPGVMRQQCCGSTNTMTATATISGHACSKLPPAPRLSCSSNFLSVAYGSHSHVALERDAPVFHDPASVAPAQQVVSLQVRAEESCRPVQRLGVV